MVEIVDFFRRDQIGVRLQEDGSVPPLPTTFMGGPPHPDRRQSEGLLPDRTRSDPHLPRPLLRARVAPVVRAKTGVFSRPRGSEAASHQPAGAKTVTDAADDSVRPPIYGVKTARDPHPARRPRTPAAPAGHRIRHQTRIQRRWRYYPAQTRAQSALTEPVRNRTSRRTETSTNSHDREYYSDRARS